MGPAGPIGATGPAGPAGSANISGTTNFLTKFTSATTGGNSLLFDNGTNVGLGTTSPGFPFHVTSANTARTAQVITTAPAGDGLWGHNTAAPGTSTGAGVVGITAQASASAAGVWGENSNANGTGVTGVANGQGATVLASGAGGSFNGLVTGLFARSATTGVGQAIYTDQFGDVVRVNYFNGTTLFKINGAGTVSTNVADVTDPTGERRVTMYAPEAPEILFQDYGHGQLSAGRAYITLDPRFSGSVVIDDKHPLRVFVQLEDDEDVVGVVVKNKSLKGFEVVERMGGKSNAKFQYQLVANRADEVLPNGRVSQNADIRYGVHAQPLPTRATPARDNPAGAQPVAPPTTTDASATAPTLTTTATAAPNADVAGEDVADDDATTAAGCSTTSGGAGGLVAMFGLLFVRRRRRRAA